MWWVVEERNSLYSLGWKESLTKWKKQSLVTEADSMNQIWYYLSNYYISNWSSFQTVWLQRQNSLLTKALILQVGSCRSSQLVGQNYFIFHWERVNLPENICDAIVKLLKSGAPCPRLLGSFAWLHWRICVLEIANIDD